MTQTTTASNRADAIGELVVDASVVALNAELADRGIGADRIVAILPVAPQTLVTIVPAKFRVLYRLGV
jgi:hypothetical protein